MRCGVRDLLEVRGRDDGPPRVVRGSPDGGLGGPNDRPFGVEELRTEVARAAALVGGFGRVCCVYYFRYTFQRHESDEGCGCGGESRGWCQQSVRLQ